MQIQYHLWRIAYIVPNPRGPNEVIACVEALEDPRCRDHQCLERQAHRLDEIVYAE